MLLLPMIAVSIDAYVVGVAYGTKNNMTLQDKVIIAVIVFIMNGCASIIGQILYKYTFVANVLSAVIFISIGSNMLIERIKLPKLITLHSDDNITWLAIAIGTDAALASISLGGGILVKSAMSALLHCAFMTLGASTSRYLRAVTILSKIGGFMLIMFGIYRFFG